MNKLSAVTINNFGIVDSNVQLVEGQDEITFIPLGSFPPSLPGFYDTI